MITVLKCLASLILFFCATNAFAASNWRPVLTIGGGTAFVSNIGQGQTFPIVDPETDQYYIYSPHNSSQNAGLINAFVGVETIVYPQWLLQTGLDYSQATSFYTSGTLTQGVDVQSQDSYNYHYNLVTRQLLFAGKLLYTYAERYHAYVFAGLGAAFNQASNYSTNVPAFLTFTRVYQANDTTSFSYAAGFGIDVDLTAHLRFGIGYRYTDLGKLSLGNATINTINVSGSLSQSNLYASQLLAQISLLM
jgi:opacity protein-like surface antigen